jgi:hypothetical protein
MPPHSTNREEHEQVAQAHSAANVLFPIGDLRHGWWPGLS